MDTEDSSCQNPTQQLKESSRSMVKRIKLDKGHSNLISVTVKGCKSESGLNNNGNPKPFEGSEEFVTEVDTTAAEYEFPPSSPSQFLKYNKNPSVDETMEALRSPHFQKR